MLLVYRASRPNVAVLGRTAGPDPAWVDLARHPAAEPVAGVEVVRVEAGLFFANADLSAPGSAGSGVGDPRAVVLDAETSPSIDVTAAQMLADLAHTCAVAAPACSWLATSVRSATCCAASRCRRSWWVCTRLWTPRWRPHSAAWTRSRPPVPLHGRWVTAGFRTTAAPDTDGDTVADGRDAE